MVVNHHGDGDEDASPPLHPSDPRDDDTRSRGERRSRRDMPAEDPSAAAAASPVKRTKSGVQIHPGSPPSLTASPGRDDDDRGSLTSTEAPWVARWLAGRGTPRHGATDERSRPGYARQRHPSADVAPARHPRPSLGRLPRRCPPSHSAASSPPTGSRTTPTPSAACSPSSGG